eukprot:6181049-Pyramimonas_sp.AAC.1
MQEPGEAPREATFTQPPSFAAMLWHVPSYESYYEQTECLCCINPDEDCMDAPELFPMELARVTR